MAARKSTQNEDTQLWYDGANLQAESKVSSGTTTIVFGESELLAEWLRIVQYDYQFTDALSTYGEVTTKLAKIHFNIGLIKLSLGRATDAITSFTEVCTSPFRCPCSLS